MGKINAKVAEKVGKAKVKIAGKAARARSKVAAKCALVVVAALAFAGCQNPAQRAQTADVRIYFNDGSSATFGSEFVSLAQSNDTGGNDAGLVASPTTDTKPEIAVGVGGSSAGVGQSAGSQSGLFSKIGAAVDAASGLMSSGGSDSKLDGDAEQSSGDCPDGNCAPSGDCPNGNCTYTGE